MNIARRTATNELVPSSMGKARIRPDGSFSLMVPGESAYVLYASSGPPFRAPGIQNEIEVGRAAIDVRTKNLSDVRISTRPGGTIHGRVWGSSDANSGAVAQLRVATVPLDAESAAAGVLSSTAVRSDGTFELHNVFGSVLLDLGPPGPAGWLKAVMVDGSDVSDSGFRLRPTEQVRDVQIMLGWKATGMFGSATASNGQPAQDYVVVVFASDEAKWWHPLTRYVRTTRSSGDGRYEIGALPPGDYCALALESLAMNDAVDPVTLARLRPAATPVRFNDGERKQVNLTLSAADAPL